MVIQVSSLTGHSRPQFCAHQNPSFDQSVATTPGPTPNSHTPSPHTPCTHTSNIPCSHTVLLRACALLVCRLTRNVRKSDACQEKMTSSINILNILALLIMSFYPANSVLYHPNSRTERSLIILLFLMFNFCVHL